MLIAITVHAEDEITAEDLILRMIDQSRGLSSYSEMSMTINRPQWQRTSAFAVWTRGREDALIRFTAPAKDAGNATLKVGSNMWTYSPKIRRAIRLPKSMMSQEWAGSDFSYNDLARSDKLFVHYEHEIVDSFEEDGITTYTIESRPKESAPVVWGMEKLVFRSDNVVLEQTYYDQELQPVKSMRAFEIQELGGRMLAKRMRMFNVDEPDTWTEVSYEHVAFDIDIDDRQFTQFALRGE
ncbi:MAG: outer membrane lipoprotein-sorting protein [Gammaproteobacteria bacterium]|nr:outer membrane lipoprotein-sorting protein [Gammaproteobacteria bacterium]